MVNQGSPTGPSHPAPTTPEGAWSDPHVREYWSCLTRVERTHLHAWWMGVNGGWVWKVTQGVRQTQSTGGLLVRERV